MWTGAGGSIPGYSSGNGFGASHGLKPATSPPQRSISYVFSRVFCRGSRMKYARRLNSFKISNSLPCPWKSNYCLNAQFYNLGCLPCFVIVSWLSSSCFSFDSFNFFLTRIPSLCLSGRFYESHQGSYLLSWFAVLYFVGDAYPINYSFLYI